MLVLILVSLKRFTSLIFFNSVANSGLLRPATIIDEFGELKLSKSMVLFSASVLLTSCSHAILSSYSSLFFSFGGFTFSNLGLGGSLFYFVLTMYLWILLETVLDLCLIGLAFH